MRIKWAFFLTLRGAVQQAGTAGLRLHHQPPSPKDPYQEPPPDRGAHLTWLCTQVGVKALRLEHDEQRAPAQEDCREEEVFQHSGAGHPPAAPMGSGQGGRHGAVWRWPGSGSADTCAQTSASAVALPNPCGRWRTATSLSAPGSPGYRCTPQKKRNPSPVRDLDHPEPAAAWYRYLRTQWSPAGQEKRLLP